MSDGANPVRLNDVLTRLYEERLYGQDMIEGFMRQYGQLPLLARIADSQLYRLWAWIEGSDEGGEDPWSDE